MANKTFKNRGITKASSKSLSVQAICGSYKKIVATTFPIEWLVEHYQKKPKTFSTRNWIFPVIYNSLDNIEKSESLYTDFVNWLSNKNKEYTIEISCKLQHLAMCFDSPHFISCGKINDSRYKKANSKIIKPYVFCIFTRDRRGLIDNRRIGILCDKEVLLYNLYGSNKLLADIFSELVTEITQKPVVNKDSFL